MNENTFDISNTLSSTNTEKTSNVAARGVPEETFVVNDYTREIRSNSGNSEFFVKVTPSSIEIDDKENPNKYMFHAQVNDGVLTLTTRTAWTDESGIRHRHPDLSAKELAIRACRFFEEQGNAPTKLDLNWVENPGINDNLKRFTEELLQLNNEVGNVVVDYGYVNSDLLAKLLKQSSPEVVKQAVNTTWSGKLAKELGFVKFDGLMEGEDGNIVAYDSSSGSVKIHLSK